MTIDYKQVAHNKAKSLINKIPKEWILSEIPSADEEPNVNIFIDKLVTENERNITNKSASELLKLQESGQLTAYEITFAFCHRTALVHQLTNCCIEIFFERAFETAKKLDDYFMKNGKLLGKLHGIPISLKDQINLPDITTSIGYVAPHISEEFELKITHRQSRNNISLIAEILQNQGAIFYVKTTVPMAMLGGETSSNLGTTYNSLDRHMSCGGSSGGEGALIAGGGSIIGLGTDIGGSIRIPSSVHGIFGLRASSNRFPYLNIANSYPNQLAVCSVVGPMCKNIDDMVLISDVILNDDLCNKDPKHLPLKWNNSILNNTFEKIKIGFLKWDNEILPHPPILNNLENLKQKLSKKSELFDCSLIEKIPVPFSTLGNLLLSLYSTDNFEEIESFCNLSGEPFSELFTRSFFKPGKVDSVSDFCYKAGLKYQYEVEFDKIFENVDCFIMPTYSTVCWRQGDNPEIANFYTRALNVLDYSVITFPVGIVTKDDAGYERGSFMNSMDERNWKYYNINDQLGKPVSLQLVCKRYHEEQCCKIVKKIIEVINYNN
jgi:amidase